MSRIFLSHSKHQKFEAVAVQGWLRANGWNGVFLDIDPEEGIAAGERWECALHEEAVRCKAFVFLVSQDWIDAPWCRKEFRLAQGLGKKLFVVLIDPNLIDSEKDSYNLPPELKGLKDWKIVDLTGGMVEIFRAVLPGSHREKHISFGCDGLRSLKHGLKDAGLDPNYFKWPPENDPERSPYPGLRSLEAADAGIFFGRNEQIAAVMGLLWRLKNKAAPRLLVLLGASGAGKSSFLRAGLLPRLARDDSNYLPLGVVRPDGPPGETLPQSLKAAFKARGLGIPGPAIREAIAGGAKTLQPLLRALVEDAQKSLGDPEAKPPTLVLAIDQGEDIILAKDSKEGDQFLALLRELMATDDPALLVLITVRSSVIEPLLNTPLLMEITHPQHKLPAMPLTNYRQVIEGPAALCHPELEIDPKLIEALFDDIGPDGKQDALPLLAFTLQRLYSDYGDVPGGLKHEGYIALGGIKGSINAAIEDVFKAADKDQNIPSDEVERLALLRRGMIPWLVTINPDAAPNTYQYRRQRARLSDIPEQARPLINLLVEHRLLSTDATQKDIEPMIEPAHEALLRQWSSLQGWLEKDSDALTTLEDVKIAARKWAANKGGEDWLTHSGKRLEKAQQLRQQLVFEKYFGKTGCDYLDACTRREKPQQESLRQEMVSPPLQATEVEQLQRFYAPEPDPQRRIFISHSFADNAKAAALRDWLAENGWDYVFLDVDPQRGLAAGELWEQALHMAVRRCEAVLFLVTRAWLDSEFCQAEFNLARHLDKRLFGVLIEDIPRSHLPPSLATWQLVSLVPSGRGDATRLGTTLPGTGEKVSVDFFEKGLNQLRIGLERTGQDVRFFDWPPQNDPERSPYPGLRPLEAADAGIFFGRDALVVETLSRIQAIKNAEAPRLLVLLGASGVGKSSLLRAGLLPHLARDDRNYLPLGVVRPSGPSGETLLQSLEAALEAQGLGMPRFDIQKAITGGAQTLRPLLQELVTEALKSLGDPEAKPPTLVLAIDQGEEFFLEKDTKESDQLLALLQELTAADDPALLVLMTIRSDAFEQLQNTPVLEKIPVQVQHLPPLPLTNYRQVIEGPAARRQPKPLEIEPKLIEVLLDDIGEDGGRDALPLLAFTMEQLYRKYGASQGRLELGSYEQLGGIKGSINAAINNAFKAANNDSSIPRDEDARLKLLRRGMIPWLAGIDPDTHNPRRQRARQSDIPKEALPLIGLLVEQRLLFKDADQNTGEPTIEVANELLLRQWNELQNWLKEDAAALINLEIVKRDARTWITAGDELKDSLLIHRGERLKDAQELLLRPDFKELLGTVGCEYLDACRRREREQFLREKEQQQKIRRQRDKFLHSQATGFGRQARVELQNGNVDRALRFAVLGTKIDLGLPGNIVTSSTAAASLWAVMEQESGHLILDGHHGLVYSAAFSPDATRIITASADRTARIWDAGTGKEIKVLEGHKKDVKSAAFSPDGTRIITASADRTARIWDADTGKEIKILKGHVNWVGSAAFSPDGTRIVTSGYVTVRIWNAATGEEVKVLTGHGDEVTSAAFSPDGTRIITASEDGTAIIWDADTEQQIMILWEHEGPVRSAAFSLDGTRVITASQDETARIWDANTGKEIEVLQGHELTVTSAAFNPDGTRIVTASRDRTARIWNAATGEDIKVLEGHESTVESATFSPDGTRVLTASYDKTARIWDVYFATMPTKHLFAEACLRLQGISKLTREEMRLLGYPDTEPEIDVCEGIR